MLVWLTLPFYDFCGFRSVAVNSVYKLQFFYIYDSIYRASIASRGKIMLLGAHDQKASYNSTPYAI